MKSGAVVFRLAMFAITRPVCRRSALSNVKKSANPGELGASGGSGDCSRSESVECCYDLRR